MEEERRPDLDQRKWNRMLSNRESARRSRMRKQRHLDDLVHQAVKLREANDQISAQVKLSTQRCARIEAENRVIRARVAELAERLRSMSSLLRPVEAANGTPMDIPEIPDPLLRSWCSRSWRRPMYFVGEALL